MMNKLVTEVAEFTGDKLATSLQSLVRTLGIPFRIYESSVRGKVQVGYTSLTGRNWGILLSGISGALRLSSGLLTEERKQKYAWLFENFHSTLSFAGKCKEEDGPKIAAMASTWIKEFLNMGFTMAPYPHIFHAHLAMSVAVLGGQDKFNGELGTL